MSTLVPYMSGGRGVDGPSMCCSTSHTPAVNAAVCFAVIAALRAALRSPQSDSGGGAASSTPDVDLRAVLDALVHSARPPPQSAQDLALRLQALCPTATIDLATLALLASAFRSYCDEVDAVSSLGLEGAQQHALLQCIDLACSSEPRVSMFCVECSMLRRRS